MRRRHRNATSGQGPRTRRPLGSDIVALLGRALREQEYAAAEHLLQALEELEKAPDGSRRPEGRSSDLETAYLEIAHNLSPLRLGMGKSVGVKFHDGQDER